MDGLKPYPEYKESGQMWMGTVPKHWDILPNRAIFEEVKERGHSDERMLSVTIKQGVIPQRALLSDSSKKDSPNQNKLAYKLVCPNDIAYNKMRAWQGAVGVSSFRGIVCPAYVIMRLRKINNPRYFHHVFRTPHFAKEAERWSYGITSDMWSLRPEHFKMIYTPLPPTDEQADIVKFLDHTSRKLNRAIRAKQKVIALLNEQKQVIIHRAVARGLNPDVHLNPSGISWLGDVPSHWGVISLRMRYSVELGKMLDVKRITGRNPVPYLRNRDVQWDRILVDDLPVMDISSEEYPRYTVRRGDMLVCEGGKVGRSAFWDAQLPICGFQKALHRVRAKDPDSDYPRFLFYLMNTAATRGAFAADGNENIFAHLTCEKLRRHPFPFPPYAEQRDIASFLDEELQHCSIAIGHTKRQISLLQEYRTRLIADVVTGKLDVREAAREILDELGDDGLVVDDAELSTGDLDGIDADMLVYETGVNP